MIMITGNRARFPSLLLLCPHSQQLPLFPHYPSARGQSPSADWHGLAAMQQHNQGRMRLSFQMHSVDSCCDGSQALRPPSFAQVGLDKVNVSHKSP